MTSKQETGLGKPKLPGKRALFRPPAEKETPSDKRSLKRKKKKKKSRPKKQKKYIRTTIKLPVEAYTILDKLKRQYQLKTGKSLPIWKAISNAVEFYGKAKKVGE